MKKPLLTLAVLSLCLALASCGGEKKSFDPAADAKALLETDGVFDDALLEIDQATACALYGIDPATVTQSAVYGSTSTADELAIFTLSDEEAAQTAAQMLSYRVEDRQEELRDYLPHELPKLEQAVVETRGNSVLLVIAADYAPVSDFLGH